MKLITKQNSKYILRLDKFEDVFQTLTSFCETENITSGHFSAIGAAKEIVLAYYVSDSKSYKETLFKENMEIVTVTGNIAKHINQTIIHAHGVFSKNDLSTIGGHIKKIVVSATCEIVLERIENKLERVKDEDTGLLLLK